MKVTRMTHKKDTEVCILNFYVITLCYTGALSESRSARHIRCIGNVTSGAHPAGIFAERLP